MYRPGCSVLDIGCGAGKLGAWFGSQGCNVTLTDISHEALALAEDRMKGSTGKWCTLPGSFDAFTGSEPELRCGFDFVLSTFSPAVHDETTVLKMHSLSRSCCFISRFTDWRQPFRDGLLRYAGLDINAMDRTNPAPDTAAFIETVKKAGVNAEFKYVPYSWCDRRTPEEMADYMLERLNLPERETGDIRKRFVEYSALHADSDGCVADGVDTVVVWISWKK